VAGGERLRKSGWVGLQYERAVIAVLDQYHPSGSHHTDELRYSALGAWNVPQQQPREREVEHSTLERQHARVCADRFESVPRVLQGVAVQINPGHAESWPPALDALRHESRSAAHVQAATLRRQLKLSVCALFQCSDDVGLRFEALEFALPIAKVRQPISGRRAHGVIVLSKSGLAPQDAGAAAHSDRAQVALGEGSPRLIGARESGVEGIHDELE
jgi:hypothetical protein